MKKYVTAVMKYLTWKRVVLLIVLIYILLLVIPYITHKKVSESYQSNFSKQSFTSESVGTERISYLNDNTDALLYRLRMMEEAEKSIILSTFDFDDDEAGNDVIAALLHAADRGVHVRVIVDGVSGFMDVQHNPTFLALDAHKNAEIRIYNPINFLKPWNMQARLHDKYVIIDDKMYLLGGRNTSNLFLGDYTKAKNIDRELFVYETAENVSESASISQVTSYFESVWNSPDSKPCRGSRTSKKVEEKKLALKEHYETLKQMYPQSFEPWNWTERTFETNHVALLSNPIGSNNKEPWVWYSLQQLMMKGENVTIYTPYIICGKEMYQGLTELNENNIPVEIITNDVAKGANPWGCTDYLNQKEKIWATGANVYEYMASHSCHTKAVLIDDNLAFVGSYNLDMRSTYLDTELMLAVDSPKLNSLIRAEAERDKTASKIMKDGSYVYGENYKAKELSLGKKIFYAILRVVVMPIRRFL